MSRAGSSSVTSGSIRSRHSNYSDISNLTDRVEDLNVSDNDRNIFSNAPSELDEAKRRQVQQQHQQPQVNELQTAQSNPHQFQQAVAGYIVQEPHSAVPNQALQQYTPQQGHVVQQSSLAVTNQALSYQQQHQQHAAQSFAPQQMTNYYQTPTQSNNNIASSQNNAISLTSPSVPMTTQYPMIQRGNAPLLTQATGTPQNGLGHHQQPLTMPQNNLVHHNQPNTISNDINQSQLSLPSPQTTQQIVNMNQYPQQQQLQLYETQNRLVSQRPPSMADIRESMTGTGQGSNQSCSSNEFGYY